MTSVRTEWQTETRKSCAQDEADSGVSSGLLFAEEADALTAAQH
jgi:hypothetical protein